MLHAYPIEAARPAPQDTRSRPMNSGKAIRVLSICDDDGIRFSRDLVLKHEGYEVESVPSNVELDPSWVCSFHIAVLCHSLSPARASEIAAALRLSNSSIRILRVHAIRSVADHLYDVDCEVLPGPGQLLSAMHTLVAQPKPQARADERKRA